MDQKSRWDKLGGSCGAISYKCFVRRKRLQGEKEHLEAGGLQQLRSVVWPGKSHGGA